jgi:hypothetical protein
MSDKNDSAIAMLLAPAKKKGSWSPMGDDDDRKPDMGDDDGGDEAGVKATGAFFDAMSSGDAEKGWEALKECIRLGGDS